MHGAIAKTFKTILIWGFSLLLILSLAWFWVLLGARPAFAQTKTINYTNTHLENRDFSHQDLSGAVFVSAEMRGATFEGSDLRNAILTQGVLLGANLQGANLTDALVDRVTFYRANLTNAIFTGAILSRTSLDEAIVTGADFSDAILDRYEVTQLCKRAEGVNPVTGVATRESLGCRD